MFRRLYFYGLNFLLGFFSLAVEILLARAIAPYWGAGTIIWGFVVGFVLLFLALGYWYGGKLADRLPDEKHLLLYLLPSALLVLPLAFLLPDTGLKLGLFSLLAAVSLFFMGAGAPWVLRILMQDIKHTGELSGRLFALSTIGSFLGSILTVVLLLPLIGSKASFLLIAFSFLLYLLLRLPALFSLSLLLFPLLFFTQNNSEAIWSKDSRDQLVRVFDSQWGRYLVLNNDNNVHSYYKKDRYLSGYYWDTPLFLWPASGQEKMENVLILGNGAGTSARSLHHFYPEVTIDAVEVDPVVNEAARRFFAFKEDERLRLTEKDARVFVRENEKKYDLIFLDVYDSSFIPFQFATREFYQELAADLEPEGLLLVNVNYQNNEKVVTRLASTGREAFPYVKLFPSQANILLLFSQKPLRANFPSPLDTGKTIELKDVGTDDKTWSDDKSDIEIIFPF